MKKYCCEDCGASFNYPSLLERHERIHTKQKIFKCHLCPKSFIRADTLKTHQNIHSNKGHVCCGKTLHSRASYKYHLKMFHVLKCPTCNQSISNGKELMKHISYHQLQENIVKTQPETSQSFETQIKVCEPME